MLPKFQSSAKFCIQHDEQFITMLLAFKYCHAFTAAAVVPAGTNPQTEMHRSFANLPLTLHEACLLVPHFCLDRQIRPFGTCIDTLCSVDQLGCQPGSQTATSIWCAALVKSAPEEEPGLQTQLVQCGPHQTVQDRTRWCWLPCWFPPQSPSALQLVLSWRSHN